MGLTGVQKKIFLPFRLHKTNMNLHMASAIGHNVMIKTASELSLLSLSCDSTQMLQNWSKKEMNLVED